MPSGGPFCSITAARDDVASAHAWRVAAAADDDVEEEDTDEDE